MNQDWIKYQKTLVEYCKFADICHSVYLRDAKRTRDIMDKCIKTDIKNEVDKVMESSFNNLEYSMKDIFEEHDRQDYELYQAHIVRE
jgi:hypothetical protein